jgi:hypothetical protein
MTPGDVRSGQNERRSDEDRDRRNERASANEWNRLHASIDHAVGQKFHSKKAAAGEAICGARPERPRERALRP